MEIKVFKANEGDSILVSCDKDKQFNMMIDMGVRDTYFNYIKPELINLNRKGKRLNLLVISHIDNDHIAGAIEFIKDNEDKEHIIRVDEVWHNTYRHLQFEKEKKINVSERTKNELKRIKDSNPYKAYHTGSKDISIKQGISFGGYLLKYNYAWNKSFNEKAVSVEECNSINFNDNIKIIPISPNKSKLNKLAKKWLSDIDRKYNIREIGEEEIWDDAFEYYMHNLKEHFGGEKNISSKKLNIEKIEELTDKEEIDKSETNGSSIAFILECKEDDRVKKLMFLGDAHEDIIFDKLRYLKDEGYDLSFDLVKISHHGSNKNISQRLINLIESDRFIISTDGKKHKHPNIETIAKILNRESRKKIEIIFNYNIPKFEFLNNAQLKNKYNYDIRVLGKNEAIIF